MRRPNADVRRRIGPKRRQIGICKSEDRMLLKKRKAHLEGKLKEGQQRERRLRVDEELMEMRILSGWEIAQPMSLRDGHRRPQMTSGAMKHAS